MQVVGRQILDFTGNDGKVVKGVKLFMMDFDDYVEGFVTGEKFFSADSEFYEKVSKVPIPCELDFEYKNTIRGKQRLVDIHVM